jgi:AcrR family transcriptional regulator
MISPSPSDAPSETAADATADAAPDTGRRRRVPAMAPEQRRAALIAATVPLLREHGLTVSTRQIADAAGVAEGTIFGVFPDKASLLRAAMISAFDPVPTLAALSGIETHLDLRARLTTAVDLLRDRFTSNFSLMVSIRSSGLAVASIWQPSAPEEAEKFRAALEENRRRIVKAVAALIGPDRSRLRRDPETVAQLVLTLVMTTAHGRGDFGGLREMHSAEIVSLLLDGLLVRPGPGACGAPEEKTPRPARPRDATMRRGPASGAADRTGDPT